MLPFVVDWLRQFPGASQLGEETLKRGQHRSRYTYAPQKAPRSGVDVLRYLVFSFRHWIVSVRRLGSPVTFSFVYCSKSSLSRCLFLARSSSVK